MLLCLDIGNSHICGGVFTAAILKLHFRHKTDPAITSDQLGLFLRNVLRENGIDDTAIQQIAISSVVPTIDYSLHAACKKYFNIEPFILKAATANIKINTLYPHETGADLIAGAIAAIHHYPQKNTIVADLGTATTLTAVSAQNELLGTVIMAGMRLSIQALSSNTAQLPTVAIERPHKIPGCFTQESMQAGLYYGHLGALKEIIARITQTSFLQTKPRVIGTGGFAHLFAAEKIFDAIYPDLVLDGLRLALSPNTQ